MEPTTCEPCLDGRCSCCVALDFPTNLAGPLAGRPCGCFLATRDLHKALGGARA